MPLFESAGSKGESAWPVFAELPEPAMQGFTSSVY
jgi:hypothetical protein